MIDLIDTHAHLQGPEFDADREAVIARAAAAGVTAIVVPAVDAATAGAAIGIAERQPGVFAAAGCHPHEASCLTPGDLAQIEALLCHPRVVAIGEIGLDFYRMHSPRDVQIAVFEQMLGLAERHALPVIVHSREAGDTVYRLLAAWSRRAAPAFEGRALGVMHYFSGTAAEAQGYVDLGFVISAHTSVTHPKAALLREAVAAIPLASLVIETDSPYGAPQAHRGRRNEPAFVAEAAAKIAAIKGISLEAVAAATSANAARLFRLPVPLQTGATV